MATHKQQTQWDPVVRALHWSMALLLTGQWILGKVAENYRMSPMKLDLFVWHKSIGMLLLLLVVIRILWRFSHPRPALPEDMQPTARHLASLSHLLLYLLMIGLPVSGWVVNSAANIPAKLFWLVPLPDLVAPDKALQSVASSVHEYAGWALLAVVGLHISAAMIHHFHYRDHVLRRMLGR